MAARRTPNKKSQNGHAFTVVLEEMRGQFRVFGEALSGLREEMNRRFDRVEGDIGVMKTDVGLLKTAVVEHGRQLKWIRAKLDACAPRSRS